MDFLTHSLIGVGASRLIVEDRAIRPQVTLAALLGALVMDGDSWLYLIGPNYYGKYHRIASHSFVGLTLCAIASAAIAWFLAKQWPRTRRFGWFAHDNLDLAASPPLAPFRLSLVCAVTAAVLHVPFDAITGFGNVTPLWPWSMFDISLHAVMSFDLVIFSLTMAWHIIIRKANWPRKTEALVSAAWFALVLIYVSARLAYGDPTYI